MIIKQTLYKLLGVKIYLVVVSRLFFISYSLGLLKKNRTFDCHYFIKKLIKNGDHIIDIGANLGYYSRLFAKLAGPRGKVHCVEPVILFRKILTINTTGFPNVSIIPYALGEEDNKLIEMGIPKSNKYLRHGLTRVLDENEKGLFEFTFSEKMYKPATVFRNMKQCDYIKCDVEGYEIHIIPHLGFLLELFHPIIQIEIEPVNRKEISDFLAPFSYRPFYLSGGFLYAVTEERGESNGDLFFVPKERMKLVEPYLSKIND